MVVRQRLAPCRSGRGVTPFTIRYDARVEWGSAFWNGDDTQGFSRSAHDRSRAPRPARLSDRGLSAGRGGVGGSGGRAVHRAPVYRGGKLGPSPAQRRAVADVGLRLL